MCRKERIISVFVASPSDVQEEREALEGIVREVNQVSAKTQGARLDLVKWETHAIPGVGVDAQDVINQSVGDDHDVFIGIFWSRLGTPTARAESGSVEEFRRAYQRNELKPGSVEIMIYFNEAPIPRRSIDPEQLAALDAFQAELAEKGVLYRSFASLEDFCRLLRIHLQVILQKSQSASEAQTQESSRLTGQPAASHLAVPETSLHDDDEKGLLDLMEEIEEHGQALGNIAQSITNGLDGLGKEITARTQELHAVSSVPVAGQNVKVAKRILNQAADSMDRYTDVMDIQTPQFSDRYSHMIEALTGVLALQSDFNTPGPEDLSELMTTVSGLRSTFEATKDHIVAFRQSVADLPRVTTKQNRARRRLTEGLDTFLMAISSSGELTDEALLALERARGASEQ